jgi:ABC-type transport system involved in multi-copper enzyme maturation permease subunit
VIGQAFGALVVATWRERLSRPIALIVCLLICVAMTGSAVTVNHALQDPTLPLGLILAAGSVGRDVSSGVLALLLTRPLVRTTYLLAKWTAVSTAVAGLACLTLVAQAMLLRARGVDISLGELWRGAFASATAAAGLISVLVLFSVLISGVGDIAIWVALNLIGFVGQRILPLRVTSEWRSLLEPKLGWDSTFAARPISWFGLTSYLSTVTLCLCLAALALNRKEISYASG